MGNTTPPVTMVSEPAWSARSETYAEIAVVLEKQLAGCDRESDLG
jgi:hypothetical protein